MRFKVAGADVNSGVERIIADGGDRSPRSRVRKAREQGLFVSSIGPSEAATAIVRPSTPATTLVEPSDRATAPVRPLTPVAALNRPSEPATALVEPSTPVAVLVSPSDPAAALCVTDDRPELSVPRRASRSSKYFGLRIARVVLLLQMVVCYAGGAILLAMTIGHLSANAHGSWPAPEDVLAVWKHFAGGGSSQLPGAASWSG